MASSHSFSLNNQIKSKRFFKEMSPKMKLTLEKMRHFTYNITNRFRLNLEVFTTMYFFKRYLLFANYLNDLRQIKN